MALNYDLSKIRIGKFRYNSPMTQVVLIGFVCFCCPGMFNCINGMGAGGQQAGNTATNGNVALYCTFAVFGVFGGAFYNYFGIRSCLLGGGVTYALYTGSLLYVRKTAYKIDGVIYNTPNAEAFVITTSAILGIGAGILWTAQGVIMMSYPNEADKGKCVAVFWVIFNMGGVMGAWIPFGLDYHNTGGGASYSTYVAFLCIMCCGAAMGILLLPPEKIVRNDGSRVQVEKFQNAFTEAKAILLLFMDKNMLLLTPVSIASNWFYTYQFNDVNSALFDNRSNSFNNAFYWFFQMIGAMIIGSFLDYKGLSRRTRAIYGLCGVWACIMIIWGGGLGMQAQYSRYSLHHDGMYQKYDFIRDRSFFWPRWFLYCCYGLLDAATQSYAYWIMGTMTNDSSQLGRYSGYYKGIQSAGAAIAWRIDAVKAPYIAEFIVAWSLLVISFPFTLILARNVKETCNEDEEDPKVKPESIAQA
ncbi:MFS general substrate transporter [Basidiobolus meristosporus CBS 931.73]|uniref:MFS general substrate transporter n=1 Tax=Basidiobolus meristosporus CBS 931.73 TaxID=1314790 RepID=A0A1Y1VUS4_9FUNG|nr:MFS general substrate transporter [Basidiobolus meristosporus CBS 931.73]ORY01649.1 MFS general substrate transporter [Basidiobolus meristosporus CBS 931.73]|eukprot:ORX64766.1 MFS general substrate transporter [Basidiobolus meristosporus CBS 931.73]